MARVTSLSPAQLQSCRQRARQHWSERKRVLDPVWERQLKALPWHVRSVLGPKKNLLLLAELLAVTSSQDGGVPIILAQLCRRHHKSAPSMLQIQMYYCIPSLKSRAAILGRVLGASSKLSFAQMQSCPSLRNFQFC